MTAVNLSEKFRQLEERNPKYAAARRQRRLRNGLVEALTGRRKRLGLKQHEVAAEMETTQSAVSDLENCAGDPRLSTLQRYAAAVGAELEFRLIDLHATSTRTTQAFAFEIKNSAWHHSVDLAAASWIQTPDAAGIVSIIRQSGSHGLEWKSDVVAKT